MRTIHNMRRHPFLFIALLSFVLAFTLVACGSNTGTAGSTNGSPTATTPSPASTPSPAATSASTPSSSSASTPSSTTVSGYGSAVGCPSDAVVTTVPKANVTIQQSNSNKTITAHPGDVIEVRLPFGHKWTGPQTPPSILELQQPAGYADKTSQVCIWHFVAKSAGSAQLNFQSRALCQPGQICAMYIANVPFNITVQ